MWFYRKSNFPHLMPNETLLIVLIAVACYLVAILTSHAMVRWILPQRLRPESDHRHRYVAIDGIRGYLAFSVYVHHCIATSYYLRNDRWEGPPYRFENELGMTSVAIFFMITAFLFWGRAHAQGRLDWKKFFISRLFRIYPLYLLVFSTMLLAVMYKSRWTAIEPISRIMKEIAKWMLFRNPDINGYLKTWIIVAGVTWTLVYEAWFYLSLPFFAGAFLQKNAVWKKLIALGIVTGLFLLTHLRIGVAATFLGGILAVYWCADDTRVKLAQTTTATLLALSCVAAAFFFLFNPFNAFGVALLTVFFVAIASGNTIFGILRASSSRWLGEVSYSMYLCHGLILWIIVQNILPRFHAFQPSIAWFALWAIGITPILVLFSSASYLFVEMPLIAVGHRIAKHGSRTSAA
jgi:peptidoglycan/LPS O-acetylase OafA/YrhL